jgi:hypothetical protein
VRTVRIVAAERHAQRSIGVSPDMVNRQLPSTRDRFYEMSSNIGASTQGNFHYSGYWIVAPLEFAQILGK